MEDGPQERRLPEDALERICGGVKELQDRLGDLAVGRGWVTPQQLQECVDEQSARRAAGRPQPLGQILLERGLVDGAKLAELLRDVDALAGRSPRFSRFETLEQIGEGAMSVVYRARDRELNRAVALKVLKEDFVPHDKIRERFRREAIAAARLSHPNVVRVFDAGEENGRFFIVTELVEGTPLSRILGERRTELRPSLEILEKAARGIHHAHEQGVIHRDLKPANILVTPSGEPKIVDFGLAHLGGDFTQLTRAGVPIGTPAYMAPEQVRGDMRHITPRTDVYALGAILYETLTGRPPFVGVKVVDVFQRIMWDEPIAPRRLNARIPADIETIALKALAKDPRTRYASAGELADDLRRHLAGEPIKARAPSAAARVLFKIRRHPAASAAIGVALVALLALVSSLTVGRVLRARQCVARARAHMSARQEAAARVADLTRQLEEARRTADLRTERAREPVWALETALQRARLEEAEWTSQAELECHAALRLAGDAEAERLLARMYFERWHDAYRRRDAADAARWRDLAVRTGGSACRDRIEKPATLALRAEGAAVYLFRYEDVGRRLRPMPWRGAPPEWPSVDPVPADASAGVREEARRRTAYPLKCSDENRVTFPIDVPAGSYLVLVRWPGDVDVRFPVWLGPGEREERTISSPEEIPPGFVYVPPGPSILGQDPDSIAAADGYRDRKTEVGGFFLGVFEVTYGEYIAFVEATRQADRLPGGYPVGRKGDEPLESYFRRIADYPVYGVLAEDADEYANWLTSLKGAGRWRFRLPTAQEWERAARGGDGRFHVWGDAYEALFLASLGSRGENVPTEPAGLFPGDESPFGIRDMAGGRSEWTGTRTPDGFHVAKGGAYGMRARDIRAANQSLGAPGLTRDRSPYGFRLAADRVGR